MGNAKSTSKWCPGMHEFVRKHIDSSEVQIRNALMDLEIYEIKALCLFIGEQDILHNSNLRKFCNIDSNDEFWVQFQRYKMSVKDPFWKQYYQRHISANYPPYWDEDEFYKRVTARDRRRVLENQPLADGVEKQEYIGGEDPEEPGLKPVKPPQLPGVTWEQSARQQMAAKQ